MGYTIPKDIKRYVLKRRLARIIPFVVLTAGLLLLFTISPLAERISETNRILYLLIGIPLICFITGVPFKLIDETWCGEVVKTNMKACYIDPQTGRFTTGRMARVKSELYLLPVLTVKTQKGRIITRRLDRKLARWTKSSEDEFKVGDIVLHVSGTDYLIRLDQKERVRCCVCGLTSDCSNDVCPDCGYSLIKSSRSFHP